VIKNCSPDLCNIIVLLQVHQKEIKAERGSPVPQAARKAEKQSAIGAPPEWPSSEAMDGEKSHVALSAMALRHYMYDHIS
jgi:hypothetical protein